MSHSSYCCDTFIFRVLVKLDTKECITCKFIGANKQSEICAL